MAQLTARLKTFPPSATPKAGTEKVFHLSGDDSRTLLETLQQLPFTFRNACINGACGICRCHLDSGEIDYRGRIPTGLWEKDIANGYILPCIAYTKDDISVTEVRIEN